MAQNRSTRHCTMLLLEPGVHLQELSLQILLRSEEQRSRKSINSQLPRGALKYTKECNPSKCCAILWWNLFHILHHSGARATGEEEELEEKTKRRKCLGCFPHTGACSRGRTVSAVWYVVWTFSSPVLFATFKPCRMLGLLFRCKKDANNHHHPYIDSTTVLSDISKLSLPSVDFILLFSNLHFLCFIHCVQYEC